MTVITRRRHTNYAIIPNGVAEDMRLTFEARGVLCYLLAKPNDWRVEIRDLMRSGGIGRDKVYRILNELLSAGYIERRRNRNENGTISEVEYIVYDDPVPDELPFPEKPEVAIPLPEKPEMASPLPEKPYPAKPYPENTDALLSNKNLPSTQTTNTPSQGEVAPSRTVIKVGRFEDLWGAWRSDYRPDNRASAESVFRALPSEMDRKLAVDLAPLYLRMMALRDKKPAMIPYLKHRSWRELADNPPPFDRDGDFVITPDRPEWGPWIEAIRTEYGQNAVLSTQRAGRIVRRDRWPVAGRPPEQLTLAVGS